MAQARRLKCSRGIGPDVGVVGYAGLVEHHDICGKGEDGHGQGVVGTVEVELQLLLNDGSESEDESGDGAEVELAGVAAGSHEGEGRERAIKALVVDGRIESPGVLEEHQGVVGHAQETEDGFNGSGFDAAEDAVFELAGGLDVECCCVGQASNLITHKISGPWKHLRITLN